ncbi:MAG: T9SS type A sorting domain-containing protein [Bacteroidales bacterium]
MKTGIFILAFFYLIQPSIAQTPENDSLMHLLAKEGTEWSIGSFSDNPLDPDFSFRMKMEGDTLINDTAYHVLQRLSPYEGINNWQACSFVRINTDSLMYYRDTINREVLIFDFKLRTGDDSVFLHPVSLGTWDDYMLDYLSDAEITNTSSMMIQGEEKMSWEISPTGTNYGSWWTEGLGPHSGLWCIHMNLTELVGLTHILLCAYQDGVVIYDNPEYAQCDYTDVEASGNQAFKACPNPFSDNVYVEFDNNEVSATVYLLDMQGRIVLQKDTNTSKTTLDTHNLPSGLYLLRTNTGYQRKLIKKM